MLEERVKQSLETVLLYTKSELGKLRAGRASVELVEGVMVEAYDAKMPLNQLATLSVPEARLVVIDPWDKTLLKPIESALRLSLPDINPVVESNFIRIPFPAPSEERRRELAREAGKIVEEGKVKIRRVREEHLKAFKEKKEESEISEDQFFRQKEELQKMVDEYNKKLEEMGERKEEEILKV